jgi:hypothetical protein
MDEVKCGNEQGKVRVQVSFVDVKTKELVQIRFMGGSK